MVVNYLFTRQMRPMKRIIGPNPIKVETEFTDAVPEVRALWGKENWYVSLAPQ